MNIGKVKQVIGAVVDIEFEPKKLPAIYNAIRITNKDTKTKDEAAIDLIVEVASHLGDNMVRAVAMSTTDGLKRGTQAIDQEGPISVPVGKGTLGRLMNVLGEPIDYLG